MRNRKTGPCFALTVCRCHRHNRAFTLYPPGHRPYGRKALAQVEPGGRWPVKEGDEQEGGGKHVDSGARVFEGTLFDAALDAANGTAWSRFEDEYGGRGVEPYWSTQLRHIEQSTRLLGVSANLDATLRNSVAEVLGVERMLLEELSAEVSTRPGYRSRGRAVGRVLESLPPGRYVMDRLLFAGHLVGLWGRPLQWDVGAGILRDAPFRIVRQASGGL
ncbi:MAG: hypothetical protein KAV82_05985 [Phycisphaerae bacterium]|nr:hypothetical protein [Phycisphaerae bacterium]